MTPEELNRTVEFIVASQARLAAAQEQDRHDRLEFEKWSKRSLDDHKQLMGRLAQLSDRQTELLDHQSQRMDRLDNLHADWLVRNEDFQKQALHLLNLILDRLLPRETS
jgi:hypothetical protein